MIRTDLDFLLLDGFDPETGELPLRVALRSDEPDVPRFLRMKLHLGRRGDPLQPLRREIERHAGVPAPPLWERGLRLVVQAVEEDRAGPGGRDPARYLWVETQILHPSDERRCTINHSLGEQARILSDWGLRLEAGLEAARAAEIFERVLLLAPGDPAALRKLSALLGGLGLAEECLSVTEQWARFEPGEPEALLRRGEALVYLDRPREALAAFRDVLMASPMHPFAHIGAAQAKAMLGGDPYPHLDAAFELNAALTAAVLRETFDYRSAAPLEDEAFYSFARLPGLLCVTPAEAMSFVEGRRLPLDERHGSVRESELSLWVGVQNRFGLLPYPLHWSAPTPAALPDVR
jgi:tetratricopeptide (TPR) repeat protein